MEYLHDKAEKAQWKLSAGSGSEAQTPGVNPEQIRSREHNSPVLSGYPEGAGQAHQSDRQEGGGTGVREKVTSHSVTRLGPYKRSQ